MMTSDGLDPRQVISVLDTDSPVTVADITVAGEEVAKVYESGLTMATLVPAVQLILHIISLRLKKARMTHEQKRQFIIDVLRYVVDNTDSGPTLEQLDEVIKGMVPSVVDAFLKRHSIMQRCIPCLR
jgi:hypothetical protein